MPLLKLVAHVVVPVAGGIAGHDTLALISVRTMKPVAGRPKNVTGPVVIAAAGARPVWFSATRCEAAAATRPTVVALTPTKSSNAQPFGNRVFVPSEMFVELTEPSTPDVTAVTWPVGCGAALRSEITFA